MLRRHDLNTVLHGKDILPPAGEVTAEALGGGLADFLERYVNHPGVNAGRAWLEANRQRRAEVGRKLERPLPARPPGFCIGCPERPVFAALKLAQKEIGPVHVAADIGCHALGTFEPFSTGHSILGYGMSLASRAGYAEGIRETAMTHGWRPPTGPVAWSTAEGEDWILLRLLAVCALARNLGIESAPAIPPMRKPEGGVPPTD